MISNRFLGVFALGGCAGGLSFSISCLPLPLAIFGLVFFIKVGFWGLSLLLDGGVSAGEKP